jgi:hypothetical protein
MKIKFPPEFPGGHSNHSTLFGGSKFARTSTKVPKQEFHLSLSTWSFKPFFIKD